MLHYLTPMHLGLWQSSLHMQIFFMELHNKRWNMWSSFSRKRLWIKPGVFIRNITATVSRQYKKLVTPIVRMFRKYFWDIIVMKKKKTKQPEQAKPPKRFRLIRSSFWFWCFRSFRFVVSGFSLGQTRSEQMNKVHPIRLFRWYYGYILPQYFQVTVSRQYKKLVTPIVPMFRKYFWDIIVMKKKTKRPEQAMFIHV